MRGALIELVSEFGYEAVTVRRLSRTAGVSTATFYRHYSNVEECFAAAYETLMRRTLRKAYEAQRAAPDRDAGVRAALSSLANDFIRHPKEARLVLIEAHAVGPPMQVRMQRSTRALERILADCFADVPSAATPHLARGIAAGVTRVARARVLDKEHQEPGPVTEELANWVLALSAAEAAHLPLTARPRNPHDPSPPAPAPDDLNTSIDDVAGDERSRILTAVVKLALLEGFPKLTFAKVRAQAGVSRRSFNARFTDVHDSFLAAIETIAASAVTRAQLAAATTEDWEAGLLQGIRELCAHVSRNPALAQLTLVGISDAGRRGLEHRERMISEAAERLTTPSAPELPTPTIATEASLASAWKIAEYDVDAGRAHDIQRLWPVLTFVILTPIVGPAAAAELATGSQM